MYRVYIGDDAYGQARDSFTISEKLILSTDDYDVALKNYKKMQKILAKKSLEEINIKKRLFVYMLGLNGRTLFMSNYSQREDVNLFTIVNGEKNE